MSTTTLSEPPIKASALKKYADKWVAIRNGRVVAHADSWEELLDSKRVHADDAYYRVPSSTTLYY